MGTGTWSLRDLLRKADAGQVYLRTHDGIGVGGSGYGREHQIDLPTVRDDENKGGSQQGIQSKETEINFVRIEEIFFFCRI